MNSQVGEPFARTVVPTVADMVRYDERERRRRRLGVLSDQVSASRAAVLASGRPAVAGRTDRMPRRPADEAAGRDFPVGPRDSSPHVTSRWHLERLPDDPDARDPAVAEVGNGTYTADSASLPGKVTRLGQARSPELSADSGPGTAPPADPASTDAVAEPHSVPRSSDPVSPDGSVEARSAARARRQRRAVAVDDVRAPSAVAEADGVADVGTPDWLRDRPDPDGDDDVPTNRFGGARIDPGRRGALTLVVVGVIAVVVTVFVVMRERPVSYPVPPLAAVQTTTVGPGAPSTVTQPAEAGASAQVRLDAPGEVVVSVVGLVHRGGLVRLPAGARVADALAAAGGAREGADLTGLNLAQRVRDGDQILVGAARPDGSSQLGSGTTSGSATMPGSADITPDTGPTGRVDLNAATETQLDALPGVGPVTARAILNWRTANGRFTSVDQLAEVDGIGPARLARLRDLVTV